MILKVKHLITGRTYMTLLNNMAKLSARLSNIPVNLGMFSTTLSFEVPTSTLATDPDTGLQYSTTTTVNLVALLQQSSSQFELLLKDIDPPWNNPNVIKVEGNLIEPYILPQTIKSSTTAKATVNDTNRVIEGSFLLLPSLQNNKMIQGHTLRGLLLLIPGAV